MPRWTDRERMTGMERELHDMAVRAEALGAHPFLTDVSSRLFGARDRLVLWNDAGSPGAYPKVASPAPPDQKL